MTTKILVNHVGFLCHSAKRVIVESEIPVDSFEIQDMGNVDSESFEKDENWVAIFRGKFEKKSGPDGLLYVGDFSEIETPGVYSVVVPELKKRSFQFVISDGAFHHIPWLIADFLNIWKGSAETSLKIRSTIDDGIRSDNGNFHPVKSGWYDAGDLRKWMTHTNLPAIGFFDLTEKLNFKRNYYHEENLFENDLLTVSDEAVNLILEMQDPETGKIFECIGAGGFGRADENMSWWYENHSGCLADNSDNRFTDNQPGSGDERTIRTDYNPLVQYTSIYILLRALNHYHNRFPEKAGQIIEAVKKIRDYSFSESKNEPLETKTSVKSWKLMAFTQLFKADLINAEGVKSEAIGLLLNFNPDISYWYQDESLEDPYRGILHSAQPVIALLKFLALDISNEFKVHIEENLLSTWRNYIQPLTEFTVFGYMPYGIYCRPASQKDCYTPWKKGWLIRRFMPGHSPQKINHGLNGHYTSWAHALAIMGNHFKNREMNNAAWNQIYWMLGFNPFSVSFITGVGYNNPMPHSRFLGTAIGGFMSGFIGNSDDTPHVDLEAKAQWNSTEFWVTPQANLCMALAELLPEEVKPEAKIGISR